MDPELEEKKARRKNKNAKDPEEPGKERVSRKSSRGSGVDFRLVSEPAPLESMAKTLESAVKDAEQARKDAEGSEQLVQYAFKTEERRIGQRVQEALAVARLQLQVRVL
eukprot:tig00020944_g16374.t1